MLFLWLMIAFINIIMQFSWLPIGHSKEFQAKNLNILGQAMWLIRRTLSQPVMSTQTICRAPWFGLVVRSVPTCCQTVCRIAESVAWVWERGYSCWGICRQIIFTFRPLRSWSGRGAANFPSWDRAVVLSSACDFCFNYEFWILVFECGGTDKNLSITKNDNDDWEMITKNKEQWYRYSSKRGLCHNADFL